jgi:hypothetical protein
MSYDFYLPCEADEFVRVTVEDDGSLFFHEYDIEADLATEELGFETPFCLQAAREWEDDPIQFICGSGAIPTYDAGLVACGWARGAVGREQEKEGLEHHRMGSKSEIMLWQAEQFFRGKRIRYGALLDLRRMLAHWLMKDQRGVWADRATFGEKKAVNAAMSCVSAVVDVERQKHAFGGITEPVESLCMVARFAQEQLLGFELKSEKFFVSETLRREHHMQLAAAHEQLLSEAIETLTKLQAEREAAA